MTYAIYKIAGIGELQDYGYAFETLSYLLLGKGKYVILEKDAENPNFWFPMCGENRFPTKGKAEEAIRAREKMDIILDAR